MKIELKLSTDALLACHQLTEKVYSVDILLGTESRVMHSIVIDIANKFGSKSRALIVKQGLFDAKKRHKITLKFFEAWALEKYIRSMLPSRQNEYQKTLLTSVANTINQKLC